MADVLLYNFELDEDCYRARLLLALLGQSHTPVAVNMFPFGEHLSPAFREISPNGLMPVLKDGSLVHVGLEDVLLHIVETYDIGGRFWPKDPALQSAIRDWIAFDRRALAPARQARLCAVFGVLGDEATLQAGARQAFRQLEDVLTAQGFAGSTWFVGANVTLADIMLMPTFALSRDYGLEHEAYPALRNWLRRIRQLPGFRPMPGIPDYF